jgi:hypothetical protein
MKSSTTGIILASLTIAARPSAEQAGIAASAVAPEEGGMFVATTLEAAWIKPPLG